MANIKIPPFTRLEGDKLYFNQNDHELVFYIPDNYFESKIAEILGSVVRLTGIFNYTIFDKSGKNNGLKTFKLPTEFYSEPSEITKIKDVSLIKEQKPADYTLLHYRKDDLIITQDPVQDVSNAEDFFKMFLVTAKFPTTIPYDELYTYFSKNASLNGFSYGVTEQLFGMMMSEICRDPKDESIPFRLSGNKNMYDYKPISVKMVPKYVSPYAAITSENWDQAVVSAILNKPGKKSPMEPILMG